ncbi:hypothetical protein [Brevibacillus sp. AY1]|uniref:hypothetical protein n=1 Tax=Brevibacillus sp. AY1 TaxID=2807621 RepID=UPI002458797D|nr:hypothetical protein [Brevibacillus sp. AY1]MDH4619300.1 hypothetical protein [Brevibacillus sp. AY1]
MFKKAMGLVIYDPKKSNKITIFKKCKGILELCEKQGQYFTDFVFREDSLENPIPSEKLGEEMYELASREYGVEIFIIHDKDQTFYEELGINSTLDQEINKEGLLEYLATETSTEGSIKKAVGYVLADFLKSDNELIGSLCDEVKNYCQENNTEFLGFIFIDDDIENPINKDSFASEELITLVSQETDIDVYLVHDKPMYSEGMHWENVGPLDNHIDELIEIIYGGETI